MNVFEILIVVICINTTLTMILVAVATLPHVKQGLSIMRDAILWGALVLILFAAVWLGWSQYLSRQPDAEIESARLGNDAPASTRPVSLPRRPN